MAKQGGGEWVGAITATEIDLKMDGVFADVAAARQAAKQARITARKTAKPPQKNPVADSPLAGEPICTICPDASDWLVARMIVEGRLVPLNLAAIQRPNWTELFYLSQ